MFFFLLTLFIYLFPLHLIMISIMKKFVLYYQKTDRIKLVVYNVGFIIIYILVPKIFKSFIFKHHFEMVKL